MTEIFVLMFNLQGWYFLLPTLVCIKGADKMVLYLEARTDFNDLTINFIKIELSSGRLEYLTWDESESGITDGIFKARYKGVYFDEDYSNGRISELNNMCVKYVEIYSESGKGNYFEIESLLFEDGLEELKIEKPCYRIGCKENCG